MKKSATITLTLAAAFGASAQAQTPLPPCDPANPPGGQKTAGCKPARGSHGLSAILHKGFGSTGTGTTSGS
jgi:hypothetical protein